MEVSVALTQELVGGGVRLDGAPADEGAGLPVDGDTAVVVLDVVRATTVLCTALGAGAAGVRPVGGVEEARAEAAARGALLVGERGGLPPEGFDLGNSPGDFTAEVCAGREVVLTTTNGTRAVERCAAAGRVLAASFLNAEATARALAAGPQRRVLLLCAGSGGRVAADDVAAAGCLAGHLALRAAAEPDDGARTAAALFDAWKHDLRGLLRRSLSGRKLTDVGLATDIDACVKVDALPLVAERDGEGVFRRTDPS